MVSRQNHLFFHRDNAPPSRQFLRDKILLKNKLAVGEILSEQIIELELRGLGLPGRTCTDALILLLTQFVTFIIEYNALTQNTNHTVHKRWFRKLL